MTNNAEPAVWFPALRAGTGVDVFTERLAERLVNRGIRAEITWLPLWAEYAPWTVPAPKPPEWATVAHVNTWLHPRFLPDQLPIVATIHHSAHHPSVESYKGMARTAYHRFWIAPNERRVLRRAGRVTAVSRFAANSAKRMLLDVPMDVVQNGIDTGRYRPGNRRHSADEPFRLLYVGSWKRLKGVDLLAPIMRELGDGYELRYTGGHAAERDKPGMPSNMHDIGRLQDNNAVVASMQDADAFLFPTRSEGFGLVAAEAMSCGLPVITTNASAMPEVVEDGVTGILCRCDDVVAFAMAVRRLSTDRVLLQRMALSARVCALKQYSEQGMIEAYVEVYRKLMAGKERLSC